MTTPRSYSKTARMLLPPEGGLVELYLNAMGESEVPDEAHILSILCLLSASVGSRLKTYWTWNIEPCTLYAALVADSAAGKTTAAMSAAMIGRQLGKEFLRVHTQRPVSKRSFAEMIGPKDDTEADEWRTKHPTGVAVIVDEAAELIGAQPGQREDQNTAGIRTIIKETFSGHSSGWPAKTDPIPESPVAVSLITTLTTTQLIERLNPSYVADGHFGRFLILPINSEPKVYSWPIMNGTPPKTIVQRLFDIATAPLPPPTRYNDPDRPTAGPDLWTTQALQTREEWLNQRNTELRADPTRIALILFKRLQSTQARLAVISAINRLPDPQTQLRTLNIDTDDVEWSINLVEYCLTYLLSLVSQSELSDEDRWIEQKVIPYLETHDRTATWSTVNKATRTYGKDSTWRERAIKGAVTANYLYTWTEHGSGRPAIMLSLDPPPPEPE